MDDLQESLILSTALDDFGPPFMAHVPVSKVAEVVPLTRSDNIGAVILADRYDSACKAVRKIRRGNPAASILVDNGLYKGNGREIGADCIDEAWIRMQFGKMALPWAMTNSGYIPAHDRKRLHEVLAWGKRSERTIVALPLALPWLTADLQCLIDEIAAAQCPVGIILEAEGDPLSTRAAVSGLIKLLKSVPRILLLRCDTATLGALAYGAAAVSIGVNSTARHLYPISEPRTNKTGKHFGPRTSVFVPALMSYKLLNKTVRFGIRQNPDSDIWKCTCSQCLGASIEWIFSSPKPDVAAFQHSLAAQAAIAKELLALPEVLRPGAWKDRCAFAQPRYGNVRNSEGNPMQPPGSLKAWVSSTPQMPQENIQ
ncbi:hypothetical protein [Mycobacteroides chelonae]|uniref:hypothetical protein n=1 Tax=Mycobacteroides chelonae TaxID=1774 RepID=UPI0018B0418D|nr:hypothetical protein [Mycobacteroides chelonae]MBF9318029.1 hypothetical protein [Mycobacteroides chelonae]